MQIHSNFDEVFNNLNALIGKVHCIAEATAYE